MKEFIRGYADSDGSVGNYTIYLFGAEGYREASELAGVPYLTAYFWAKRNTKTWQEYSAWR